MPDPLKLDIGGRKAAGRAEAAPPELVRLLCISELAELLQVPVATIYRWRHRREGPEAFRVGRHLRFDPSDVARWIDELKANAAEGRYRDSPPKTDQWDM